MKWIKGTLNISDAFKERNLNKYKLLKNVYVQGSIKNDMHKGAKRVASCKKYKKLFYLCKLNLSSFLFPLRDWLLMRYISDKNLTVFDSILFKYTNACANSIIISFFVCTICYETNASKPFCLWPEATYLFSPLKLRSAVHSRKWRTSTKK